MAVPFAALLFACRGQSDSVLPQLGSGPAPPKYVGVYVDVAGELVPLTYSTSKDRVSVVPPLSLVLYTLGIDLNAGIVAPLNPARTVGVQSLDREFDYFLDVEQLDTARHFYRYTLKFSDPLPDGVYAFFIRERLSGGRDQFFFRVESPKQTPTDDGAPPRQ